MTGPIYKDASFWMTIVGAIAAVIGGIFTDAEMALFSSAAGLVIAYLIKTGIIQKAEVTAMGHYRMGFDDGQAAAYEQIEKAD